MYSVFAFRVDGRKLASYAVIAFLLGSLWGVAMWNIGGVQFPFDIPFVSGSLKRFTSENELKTFLNNTSPMMPYYEVLGGIRFLGVPSLVSKQGSIAQGSISISDLSIDTPEFSGTNIQVEGVDEADVVKTDGRFIYVVAQDSIVIVKAYPPTEAQVLSRIFLNQSVGEIFVNGDKLSVFLFNTGPYYILMPSSISKSIMPPIRYEPSTVIRVYDISDRTNPKLERSVEVDGYYVSSRMIGDYVYLITTQSAYLNVTEVVLPTIRTDEMVIEVPATSILYANYTDSVYAYTNVFSMNIKDSGKPLSHETLLMGGASNIYVSSGNIYVIAPRYQQVKSIWIDETMIYKISVDGDKIAYVADGMVPGWVLNQFSMDEYNGYFRIATTVGQAWDDSVKSKNNVYVLNSSLGIVGRLEDLAPGEQIYSARFMGTRCYLVTFKKVDPLFVIDLSSPTSPKVLGKLKIPGFSDYLHPYDENHLIGIGKETVESEEGDFAWYQGVKISLFDVTDVANPKELAKYEIGDRGTDSPALYDHKAFLFSKSRNLLVIPVLEAKINPNSYGGSVPANAYGDYVYQGAYVFDISLNKGIELRGRITHLNGVDDLDKSGFYFDSGYSVERSLYIEDTLYTISDKMIKMNVLDTLNEINKVSIQ